ncbi:acetyl-CoA carboxylase biotin carboxyl carrier protein [Ichthyobacterium seriolicida]|uniref:Biotin carboxyl carrier protein of acetyl-CoA carboxylase n=1 Tax=Ichthyobacterium seriolicida TaxID=242600 RepID=A0A1J1DX24_9FLAO|nr:acetyl-CoA carboxylase biotin carboxyl carrier protein [Ichthyobacterium seriolicida]BAV94407.1 acetyl-CoA carboxylase [Ichthyobacterium seriolicida]
MDIKEIQNLIKLVSKSDVSELSLENDGFKITIKTNKSIENNILYQNTSLHPSDYPSIISHQDNKTPVIKSDIDTVKTEKDGKKENLLTIKSPMIGTFYRSPSPDKDMFVKVGDLVSKGDVVCIVEAMKLFNEIESEYSGKIVEVLVDNLAPVEFDQPLFLIEPSS